MGVVTTFDEKRQEAKDALKKAIEALQQCTNEETWGYSDMKESYIDELTEVLVQLIQLKRKL